MKPGEGLEKDVQHVYTSLLNMRDEGIVVGSSVFMVGKSGVKHEIDVFYEFERAGIRHRVAIECKDWGSPVSKGRIQEFESKIRDIGNITGVVVSRNGYQSGAEAFAEHYDILTLRFEDLPALNVLMANRLAAVALPDETYIGEPFWTIMGLHDGEVSGTYYAPQTSESREQHVPLTFSKYHAELLLHRDRLDPEKWAVRGLPRYAFRAFLIQLELFEKKGDGGAIICFLPPGAEPDAPMVGLKISRDLLISEYYGGEIPSIEEVDFQARAQETRKTF